MLKSLNQARLYLLFIFLFPTITAYSQKTGGAVWENETINIGTVLEEDGLQTVTFNFTHDSDSILWISEVLTDCGCTSSEFTQDSLSLGDEGMVKVVFDPSTSAGEFRRMVIVKGNLESMEDTLYLEGSAIPFPEAPLIEYPVKKLDYGLRQPRVNVGEVFTNEPKIKAIELFNFGAETLYGDSLFFHGPEYISLVPNSDSIPSQKRGLIEIAYDGKAKDDLGFFQDAIFVGWNGGDSIRLDLVSEVFDYFPPVRKEDMYKVPQLAISKKEIDWKDISENDIQEAEVMLSNRGHEELVIRKVQGNCSCMKIEITDMTIAAGKSIPLKITFDPAGRRGRDQRNVYIFTNDPINSVQGIILKSRIE